MTELRHTIAVAYTAFFVFCAVLLGIFGRREERARRRELWLKYFVYLLVTGTVLSAFMLHAAASVVVVAAVLLVSLDEFLRLTKGHRAAGMVVGAAVVVSAALDDAELTYRVFVGGAFALLVATLFSRGERARIEASAFTLVGVAYIPLLGVHLLFLRSAPSFLHRASLFYFMVLVSDAGGLIAGKLFGKRKIFPHLSPGKTWGGSVGGLVTTIVASALLVWGRGVSAHVEMALVALSVGVACQIGDVVASAFKRAFGVKDYGTWMPTFGGMLDRFDAFIFASPVFYFATRAIDWLRP